MRKLNLCLTAVFAIVILASCGGGDDGKKYTYESVPNDPVNARIYTLDNGLKVYMSVNKDKPRINSNIVVRVGSKNDPHETTGLAHYFEHLMFKGTKKFGTSDYTKEEPILNEIESLFETYRKTTDEAQRKAIYAKIDSVSQEAAKIAIPNEYDKLMAAIGSQGTNAFTSYDLTAYIEDIPSNELENWAMIQADRFTEPVLRGFHTELETVYEEYNMSLTRDSWRVGDTLMAALFPHHPYGMQTVLGSQENLKNPSITNIKNYFKTYYVPNNIAICLSGDINPDSAIVVIDKYFGSMQRKDVPQLKVAPETPIQKTIVKEVIGLEAENVTIGYRLPGANNPDAATLEFVDYLLTNGNAGLIDLNLVQKQKVLRASSGSDAMADYSMFTMEGTPKQGQSLEEVRDLLLGQLDLLKKGEFDESLLTGVINNFKLNKYYQQQEPEYAAYMFLDAFVNQIDWKDVVNKVDYQSKITKQNVIDFCNKYFNDNYAIVYKRQGKPADKKIEKPHITPIPTNRDSESQFLADIKARAVTPIEPVFVDYEKDMAKLTAKNNIPVLYVQNTTNPLFSLSYVYEMGNNNDKALGTAFNYLNYLGTSTKTAEQIKSELYQMACSFGVSASNDRVYVYVNGLADNFDKAIALLEERLADANVDQGAYTNLVDDILKRRIDAKLNQGANFGMLRNYAIWGPKSAATNILTAAELKAMNPQELVDRTKNLKNYEHKILYYGPLSKEQIVGTINKNHAMAEKLQPVPAPVKFEEQPTTENTVLLANYDAKQIYMAMVSKGVTGFDKNIEPICDMYNSYFGGGMNSIVFQEMREARGLAYTARASYNSPDKPELSYYLSTFIATQNDKMKDAIHAFLEILNNMPESEKAFKIAKESIITDIRTARTLRESILWSYLHAQEFGYTTDSRKELFEKIPNMTLADVKAFQEQYVKNKPFVYCILGDAKDLDMGALQKMGKIKKLTQEEIFGY